MDDVEAGFARLSAFNTLATTCLSGRGSGWLTTSPTLTRVPFDGCKGETGHGASFTWRTDELQRFAVQLERQVDPHRMIPSQYWKFDGLPIYTKGNSLKCKCVVGQLLQVFELLALG